MYPAEDATDSWRRPGSSYCKTERRQYDVVVAAAHMVIKYHMGEAVTITSDGRASDQEWLNAIALFETTFPERSIDGLLPSR